MTDKLKVGVGPPISLKDLQFANPLKPYRSPYSITSDFSYDQSKLKQLESLQNQFDGRGLSTRKSKLQRAGEITGAIGKFPFYYVFPGAYSERYVSNLMKQGVNYWRFLKGGVDDVRGYSKDEYKDLLDLREKGEGLFGSGIGWKAIPRTYKELATATQGVGKYKWWDPYQAMEETFPELNRDFVKYKELTDKAEELGLPKVVGIPAALVMDVMEKNAIRNKKDGLSEEEWKAVYQDARGQVRDMYSMPDASQFNSDADVLTRLKAGGKAVLMAPHEIQKFTNNFMYELTRSPTQLGGLGIAIASSPELYLSFGTAGVIKIGAKVIRITATKSVAEDIATSKAKVLSKQIAKKGAKESLETVGKKGATKAAKEFGEIYSSVMGKKFTGEVSQQTIEEALKMMKVTLNDPGYNITKLVHTPEITKGVEKIIKLMPNAFASGEIAMTAKGRQLLRVVGKKHFRTLERAMKGITKAQAINRNTDISYYLKQSIDDVLAAPKFLIKADTAMTKKMAAQNKSIITMLNEGIYDKARRDLIENVDWAKLAKATKNTTWENVTVRNLSDEAIEMLSKNGITPYKAKFLFNVDRKTGELVNVDQLFKINPNKLPYEKVYQADEPTMEYIAAIAKKHGITEQDVMYQIMENPLVKSGKKGITLGDDVYITWDTLKKMGVDRDIKDWKRFIKSISNEQFSASYQETLGGRIEEEIKKSLLADINNQMVDEAFMRNILINPEKYVGDNGLWLKAPGTKKKTLLVNVNAYQNIVDDLGLTRISKYMGQRMPKKLKKTLSLFKKLFVPAGEAPQELHDAFIKMTAVTPRWKKMIVERVQKVVGELDVTDPKIMQKLERYDMLATLYQTYNVNLSGVKQALIEDAARHRMFLKRYYMLEDLQDPMGNVELGMMSDMYQKELTDTLFREESSIILNPLNLADYRKNDMKKVLNVHLEPFNKNIPLAEYETKIDNASRLLEDVSNWIEKKPQDKILSQTTTLEPTSYPTPINERVRPNNVSIAESTKTAKKVQSDYKKFVAEKETVPGFNWESELETFMYDFYEALNTDQREALAKYIAKQYQQSGKNLNVSGRIDVRVIGDLVSDQKQTTLDMLYSDPKALIKQLESVNYVEVLESGKTVTKNISLQNYLTTDIRKLNTPEEAKAIYEQGLLFISNQAVGFDDAIRVNKLMYDIVSPKPYQFTGIDAALQKKIPIEIESLNKQLVKTKHGTDEYNYIIRQIQDKNIMLEEINMIEENSKLYNKMVDHVMKKNKEFLEKKKVVKIIEKAKKEALDKGEEVALTVRKYGDIGDVDSFGAYIDIGKVTKRKKLSRAQAEQKVDMMLNNVLRADEVSLNNAVVYSSDGKVIGTLSESQLQDWYDYAKQHDYESNIKELISSVGAEKSAEVQDLLTKTGDSGTSDLFKGIFADEDDFLKAIETVNQKADAYFKHNSGNILMANDDTYKRMLEMLGFKDVKRTTQEDIYRALIIREQKSNIKVISNDIATSKANLSSLETDLYNDIDIKTLIGNINEGLPENKIWIAKENPREQLAVLNNFKKNVGMLSEDPDIVQVNRMYHFILDAKDRLTVKESYGKTLVNTGKDLEFSMKMKKLFEDKTVRNLVDEEKLVEWVKEYDRLNKKHNSMLMHMKTNKNSKKRIQQLASDKINKLETNLNQQVAELENLEQLQKKLGNAIDNPQSIWDELSDFQRKERIKIYKDEAREEYKKLNKELIKGEVSTDQVMDLRDLVTSHNTRQVYEGSSAQKEISRSLFSSEISESLSGYITGSSAGQNILTLSDLTASRKLKENIKNSLINKKPFSAELTPRFDIGRRTGDEPINFLMMTTEDKGSFVIGMGDEQVPDLDAIIEAVGLRGPKDKSIITGAKSSKHPEWSEGFSTYLDKYMKKAGAKTAKGKTREEAFNSVYKVLQKELSEARVQSEKAYLMYANDLLEKMIKNSKELSDEYELLLKHSQILNLKGIPTSASVNLTQKQKDSLMLLQKKEKLLLRYMNIQRNISKQAPLTDSKIRFYKKITNSNIDRIKSDELRKVVKDIYSDPFIENNFWKSKAASSKHHAYEGGLAQHTLNVLEISDQLKRIYPGANDDLLLAGALLHDIGKVYEYSDAGRKAIAKAKKAKKVIPHHIQEGHDIIQKHIKASKSNDPLLQQLDDIISTHHGRMEWGNLKEISDPHQVIIHVSDMLDSRMTTESESMLIAKLKKLHTQMGTYDQTSPPKGSLGFKTLDAELPTSVDEMAALGKVRLHEDKLGLKNENLDKLLGWAEEYNKMMKLKGENAIKARNIDPVKWRRIIDDYRDDPNLKVKKLKTYILDAGWSENDLPKNFETLAKHKNPNDTVLDLPYFLNGMAESKRRELANLPNSDQKIAKTWNIATTEIDEREWKRLVTEQIDPFEKSEKLKQYLLGHGIPEEIIPGGVEPGNLSLLNVKLSETKKVPSMNTKIRNIEVEKELYTDEYLDADRLSKAVDKFIYGDNKTIHTDRFIEDYELYVKGGYKQKKKYTTPIKNKMFDKDDAAKMQRNHYNELKAKEVEALKIKDHAQAKEIKSQLKQLDEDIKVKAMSILEEEVKTSGLLELFMKGDSKALSKIPKDPEIRKAILEIDNWDAKTKEIFLEKLPGLLKEIRDLQRVFGLDVKKGLPIYFKSPKKVPEEVNTDMNPLARKKFAANKHMQGDFSRKMSEFDPDITGPIQYARKKGELFNEKSSIEQGLTAIIQREGMGTVDEIVNNMFLGQAKKFGVHRDTLTQFNKALKTIDNSGLDDATKRTQTQELIRSFGFDGRKFVSQADKSVRTLQGWYFEPEVANYLNKSVKFTSNKVINAVIDTINVPTRWWKTMATVLITRFHLRNFIGNTHNSYVVIGGGVLNPTVNRRALKLAMGELDDITIKGVGKFKAQDYLDLMERDGIFSLGGVTGDLAKIDATIWRLRGASKMEKAALLNPFGSNSYFAKAGLTVGQSIESFSRMNAFIAAHEKYGDHRMAAKMTNKALFNYRDVTQFEDSIMKTIFPFYIWSRKNIPLQGENFLKMNPRLLQIQKGLRHIEKSADASDEQMEFMPDYVKQGMGMFVPFMRDDKGLPTRTWLPGLPSKDLFQGPIGIASGINPVFKIPYELAANKTIFGGREIRPEWQGDLTQADNLISLAGQMMPELLRTAGPFGITEKRESGEDPSYYVHPYIKYGLDNIPVYNFYQRYVSKDIPIEDVINFVSSIRLMEDDLQRNKYFNYKEEHERLSRLRNQLRTLGLWEEVEKNKKINYRTKPFQTLE